MGRFMKKNNKGFSLVELVVVILIMAILAVAIAPNVFKWVENAKLTNDTYDYEALLSALQESIADSSVVEEIKNDSDIKLTIQEGTNTLTAGTGHTCNRLKAALSELLPNWEEVSPRVRDAVYIITVNKCHIERTVSPDISGVK